MEISTFHGYFLHFVEICVLRGYYPYFVEISMFCRYYPYFMETSTSRGYYPHFVDVSSFNGYYPHFVDIIYIDHITSYLACNVRPIFQIYSFSEIELCIKVSCKHDRSFKWPSASRHRWELPDNYLFFNGVMVIYHCVERIWIILVTPDFLYNIYNHE